jgi:thiol:disulfide interchange protein DsbD
MIPITIRLLANQTAKPLASAASYAGGIVATYTSLGVIAALSGALFGNLIAHPAVAITFGVVMFLLGVNMLGFGDLTKLQQIGGQIGSSKGGLFNAFLMGAGAGLVASPCTGPILAALLTYTAGRQNTMEAIGLLGIYSIGFALPYVFLGASAAKISKVRVNFQIQILTKLVFASVMFALSLYFLRLPLYSLFTHLKPYWAAIGSIGLGIGIALSIVIIAKESLHHQKAFFLVPTLALGVGIFFGIQALTRSEQPAGASISWVHSEEEAIKKATETGRPIIVDAWAEWCEACKKMDVTTFVDPSVVKEISENWIALKFDLTEPTDENTDIQDRYELPGLPTLTLLPPNGNLKEKFAISGYASAEKLLETMKERRLLLINAGQTKTP